MAVSSIGDGGVHNGGSFANVGCRTGLILPFLERLFVGPHSILHMRMTYYASGYVITRAETDVT